MVSDVQDQEKASVERSNEDFSNVTTQSDDKDFVRLKSDYCDPRLFSLLP